MNARLASGFFVSALLRDVHAQGGTGVVVARGDAIAGAVLLVCREKGRLISICEQRLALHGHYVWSPFPLAADVSDTDIEHLCQRRRQIDPDLWIIELDIVNVERFIADISNYD